MAPKTENLKMLRVVVREDFTKSRCDQLLNDIKLSRGVLEEMDKEAVQKHQDYVKTHSTHAGKSKHNHPHYKNEKHSLQGKTGKTHAVC